MACYAAFPRCGSRRGRSSPHRRRAHGPPRVDIVQTERCSLPLMNRLARRMNTSVVRPVCRVTALTGSGMRRPRKNDARSTHLGSGSSHIAVPIAGVMFGRLCGADASAPAASTVESRRLDLAVDLEPAVGRQGRVEEIPPSLRRCRTEVIGERRSVCLVRPQPGTQSRVGRPVVLVLGSAWTESSAVRNSKSGSRSTSAASITAGASLSQCLGNKSDESA
jgi:hypothetical protein